MPKTETDRLPWHRLAQACEILRLLTHPQRLRICELLLEREHHVGELAEALRVPQSIISGHLTHLRGHGVVAARRDGRNVSYRVIHPGPAWLLECIRRNLPDDQRGQPA